MMLSDHFSLEELTASQTAQRMKLDNSIPLPLIDRLRALAGTLEQVRTLLAGAPIIVSSGYRSPIVNQAIGGSSNSAHCMGWAVDFIAPRFGSPLDICRAIAVSSIPFDQLIEEGTWVHLSIDPRERREVLTMRNGQYQRGLT